MIFRICGKLLTQRRDSTQTCVTCQHAFCRHALPLFTSLLNVVCAYDPVGYGIPYNHLLFSDYREQLVEQAVQILIVALEHDGGVPHRPASPSSIEEQEVRQQHCLKEISLMN